MKKESWYRAGQTMRHTLFTLVALIGCIAPFVTRRHFPVHSPPGTEQPMVMSWVGQPEENVVAPVRQEPQFGGQMAGQVGVTTKRVEEFASPAAPPDTLNRANCEVKTARS